MHQNVLHTCRYESDLIGPLTLVSNGKSLIACRFTDNGAAPDNMRASNDAAHGPADHQALNTLAATLKTPDGDPVLALARSWLDRYFAKDAPSPAELPLEPVGTPFQHRVWNILREIPYGEVVTYGEIAKRLSDDGRMSSQAVGGAVGRNPLGIIVPCHRVIGANGNLTGFGGGLPVKIALLQHEGIDTSKFHLPRNRSRKTGK